MIDPISLFYGRPSDESRLIGALLPAAVIAIWIALGLVVYLRRQRRYGCFQDAETSGRGATPILGMKVRLFFTWLFEPIWRALLRVEVPASAITLLSALLSIGAGIAVAFGRFSLGGWIYLATGLCDFIDGRLARESKTAGPRGAVLDSVIDRYTESTLLIGLTWFYRESPFVLVAIIAHTGSLLVPYVRARAEAAGAIVTKVGLMQRPERVVLLGLATAIAPAVDVLAPIPAAWPRHSLTVMALFVLAIASHFTTIQRLLLSIRSLPGAAVPALTVRERVRHGLGFVVEGSAFVGFFLLDIRPVLAAFVACLVGATVAPFGSGYRDVFVRLSSALLVAGALWLLVSVGGVAAFSAWLLARVAVQIAWVTPNLSPRTLADDDAARHTRA